MFTIKNLSQAGLAMTIAAASFMPGSVQAQTCIEPTASQFRTDTLIAPVTNGPLTSGEYTGGAAGVVQMAIAPDGRIFIGKMQTGEIRVFNGVTGQAPLVHKIPTWFSTEDGLLGIALDPNFTTTKWLYALYSDPCGLNCANRANELARFTVTNVNGRDTLLNKKVILRFARETTDDHHAAGGITFDKSGVLIIGTGDNTEPTTGNNNAGYAPIYYPTRKTDAQRTSGNTNDLRGKVLRIKPITFADATTPVAGIGTTYDIPAGNLWEKINDPAFNPAWNNAEDTLANVRKEIFTMGHRNPFHPRVDDATGWIFFGEVGPDAANADTTDSEPRGPMGHEEWNLAYKPGFYGHPYCMGKNQAWNSRTSPSTAYGTKYDCTRSGAPNLTPLKNVSPNNTGIKNLPAAIPAVFAYANNDQVGRGSGTGDSRFQGTGNQETSVGGPMYRYSLTMSDTGGKFPPYYEGKILWFDWGRPNSFRWLVIKPNGTLDTGAASVRSFNPPSLPQASYIDAQFGNEGALYLLRFTNNAYSGAGQAGLYRVRYTGAYDNACYQTFVATVGSSVSIDGSRPAIRKTLSPNMIVNGLVTLPVGYRSVALYNLSGRKVWSYNRATTDHSEAIKIPTQFAHGLLQAKLIP